MDGDTLLAVVDLGFRVLERQRLRLAAGYLASTRLPSASIVAEPMLLSTVAPGVGAAEALLVKAVRDVALSDVDDALDAERVASL